MHNNDFEAPELIMVGQAEDVILGAGLAGSDLGLYASEDFEFEVDA